MTQIIEFINQIDLEALKLIPGMSAALAERILAARPFADPEELVKVQGLTEKKLASLQQAFEDSQKLEPESLESETEPEADTTIPARPARSGKAGRIVAWVVIVLVILAGVAAAIYWGVPFVYEKYIRPVEENAANITDLASQQSAEVAKLTDEIALLQERVSTLEVRADGVDQTLESHDASLARLEDLQKLLNQQMETQKSDLLQEIANQVSLTRGIELLSRSRLYLSESNFGLAKEDLRNSRDLFYGLLSILPAQQSSALRVVISRIDLALENLPTYPVVAVYDVDTAWQLLVDGLPNVPAMAVTPIVLPAEDATPVVTPEATVEATQAP
jgi:F0F1-type ATP synthase membrane subunit b/b'